MTDGPQYPQYPQYPGQQPQQPPNHQAPPPGYYPPPPPGYQPPPGYGAALLGVTYADWGSRLGAYLLDAIFSALAALPLGIIGGIIFAATSTQTVDDDGYATYSGANPIAFVFIALTYVAAIVFWFYNYVFRLGRTGQTLGKSVVGIKVVREDGQPVLGKGLAFGRTLLSGILTAFTCYLNLLWPLWDEKNQTLHDKAVSTVVIKV